MKLNFRGGSSTLTDTEKSQPSEEGENITLPAEHVESVSETELSGNEQEQEREDKQEEKFQEITMHEIWKMSKQ